MPLIKASMTQAFLEMAQRKPKDRAEVARKWASAYDSYASLAMTGNGGAAITAGKKSALEATLLAVLSIPIGVPVTVASAWAAGLAAYWGGMPFTPGAVPNPPFTLPGVASPPAGAAALVPALTALYATPNPENVFAEMQATALDAATRTVTVVFGPLVVPVM